MSHDDSAIVCAHCAMPAPPSIRPQDGDGGRWFCCGGCRAVYGLLCALSETA